MEFQGPHPLYEPPNGWSRTQNVMGLEALSLSLALALAHTYTRARHQMPSPENRGDGGLMSE